MNNEKTRTFISIEFPDEVIKEVARIQNLIKNKKFTGKITELENLHLTLKFLGEINNENLNRVKKLLSEIKLKEFEAKLTELGTFSYRGAPKIVWIKVGGEGIFNLQKQIDVVLTSLLKPEERFMSHLTIARIKYVKDIKDFYNYIENISVKPIKFSVKSFKLKYSELKPLGPVYKTIKEFKAIN
ncbi:RNA 2',3'-cyclic phosphodiesterase [Candidatus Pacearchaeota archaeon]|nr:RNA 2',3'-cyclic phosphodiesterase [Candidatus Pacearchaeota archaeon]